MSESYIPLRGRAQAVTVVLIITAVVCVGAVISDIFEWRLLDRMIAGDDWADAEATSNDTRQGTIGLVQFALFIAGAVVFIRWMYGAYQNLDLVAPGERRYSAGWAIGSWFVPIMNLFRPKQMINDIWRAGGRDTEDAQPGFLLLSWWLLWLLSSWIVNAAARLYQRAETAEEIKTGTILYLISDAMSVVCAILAIIVVRKGTDRLDAKAAAAPPTPPAPEPDFMAPERPAGVPA
jgi:heme/copper-type cytochrome/quinol oxidase subunit 3